MDPFELLKKDHKRVSKLFEQIEAAATQAKMGIFRQLKSELDVHAHIEEKIFYPALEGKPETRDITLEAYEEHRVVKDLLAQLDASDSADKGWEAKLTVLKENVEHHVDEEEGELFDKANDVLTAEQAEQLGDEMQAEKNRQGSGRPPKEAVRSREQQRTSRKKPGLLRSLANALGLGDSDTRPARSTSKAGKKRTTKTTKKAGGKSTKKTAAKSTRKTAAKGSKKSSPKSGTSTAAKRTATAKRGSKGTKRAARKR